MNNLRIKHVITAVVGVLILLTIAVGAIGFHTTQRAVDLLENSLCAQPTSKPLSRVSNCAWR